MREFSAVVLTSSVSEFVDTNEIVLISPLSERAFVHSVLMTPAKRSNSFVTCKMHDVPLNIWESLDTCWPRLSTSVPLLPPQRLKPLGPGTLMLWQYPFQNCASCATAHLPCSSRASLGLYVLKRKPSIKQSNFIWLSVQSIYKQR